MKRQYLILLFATIFAFKFSAGQVLHIHSDSIYNLGPHLEIYVDKSRELSLDNLLSGQYQFENQHKKYPLFAKSEANVWLRFSYKNISQDPLYLEIKNPHIDTVFLYQVKNNEIVNLLQNGEAYPFSFKKVKSNNIIFQMPENGGEGDVFYLRMHITKPRQFPIYLSTIQAAEGKMMNDHVVNGIFYGVIFMMIFYNLFLWLKLREGFIPLFLLYLGFLLLFILYRDGLAFKYFWPELPGLNKHYAILPGIAGIFSVLFMINYLNLKVMHPVYYKIGLGLIALTLAGILWNILGFTESSYKLILSNIIFGCLSYIYLSYSYRKSGIRSAQYFLLAWTVLAIFAIILIGHLYGFIGYNKITGNALKIGALIQAMILALATGENISSLVGQIKTVQIKRKRLLDNIDDLVERKVEKKTVDLDEKDKFKNQVISIVSHDLKSPLNALQMVLSLLEEKALSEQEAADLMEKIKLQVSKSSKLIENVLHWSGKQVKGFTLNKLNKDINQLVKEEIKYVESSLAAKNLSIFYNPETVISCKVDADIFQLILRNLLSNAIKFSPENSTIKITTQLKDKFLVVAVIDQGLGIPPEKISSLLDFSKRYTTRGTASEVGSGLGLKLSSEFAHKHGGRIHVESAMGYGSTFTFTLRVD